MAQLILFMISALASCRFAAADFGLAGQLFQLSGQSSVSNAKLGWATVSGASSYRVERSSNSGAYSTIATVPGNTYDDYGLTVDTSYRYRITALAGSSTLDKSTVTTLKPFTPQGTYSTFDNVPGNDDATSASDTTTDAEERRQTTIDYRYKYNTFSNRSFSHFSEEVSKDGGPWTGDRIVMTNVIMCASADYSCKLERIQWKKHPVTGQYVMWAHFERFADYGLGQVCNLYTTKPGVSPLTFGGAYRPLGHDSRDVTFFNDGNSGYLISATNVNADMNIYSLTSNWTVVDALLTTVGKGEYREAPAIIKSNGWFYIFSSRASGWVPSQPQYITAQSMKGPWSSGVNVANTATFASQSGGIQELSNGQFMMFSDRWSSSWPTPGGPTRQLNLPISLSTPGGFATYHFYPEVKYSTSVKTEGQAVYGVQDGRILSNNKPSSSDADTANIKLANDGVENDPNQTWVPTKVPFWYQIDLGEPHVINRVELTTRLIQGSETFYKYNVTASTDKRKFTLLADKSDNTDPGFSTVFSTSTDKFRYVRINVQSVVNSINNDSASWTVGVNEVTVYGD